ncbi:hypothetical protein K3495_g12254, partial [Podosphaera aphanis]
MSLFGLSKADREIIAQNPGLDQTGNSGDQLWRENVVRSGHIPGNYGEDSDSGPNRRQADNVKSKLKGKGIDRNPERKTMDEPVSSKKNLEQATSSKRAERRYDTHHPPNENDYSRSGWDRPTVRSSGFASRTLLDWALFDWKPPQSAFLSGIGNWSMYRETLFLQLECIGYELGMKLTPLDELKFAAVVQRTTTVE